MGYVRCNENPRGKRAADCTVRALSTLFGEEWDDVYLQLCLLGYDMCDMPSSKAVVAEFMKDRGFDRFAVPSACPYCYSVRDFCRDYPRGKFLLATDSHVIPVVDGDYIDTWDSGGEMPLMFWTRGEGYYAGI